MPYSALKLSDHSRRLLLNQFPPKYSRVLADSITVHFPSNILPRCQTAKVIGYAETDGLQVLACKVDNSRFRKDKRKFHITLSLDPARFKPVDANEVLERSRVRYFHDEAIPLQFTPIVVETK